MADVLSGNTGTSAAKSLFSRGVNIPKWVHYLLTGILPGAVAIPFVGPVIFSFPFTFGTNGLNLLASNSMSWAAGKLFFNMMCQLFYKVLAAHFALNWWLPVAKFILNYANPWYTYDIMRVYSPDFDVEGYKVPFMNMLTSSDLAANRRPTEKDIGYQPLNSQGNPLLDSAGEPIRYYGWMGAVAFGAMLALFIPAFSTFTAVLPPDIQAKINPWLNFLMTTIGAIAAVGGGGITSVVLLPKMIGAVQSSFTTATAATGREQGGGASSTEPYNPPSVLEVAEGLLNKGNGSNKQDGGAAVADQESNLFMGILAFTMVSGISLALIRSKGVSDPKL